MSAHLNEMAMLFFLFFDPFSNPFPQCNQTSRSHQKVRSSLKTDINNLVPTLFVRPKFISLKIIPACHYLLQCAVKYGSFTYSASIHTMSCSSLVSSFATLGCSVPPITACVNASA